jgi:hypothetical protein
MRTNFEQWKLNAIWKGDKQWHGNPRNHNNYVVTVTNTETRKRTRFDFWQSIAQPKMETENDLLWAFRCFLEDGLATMQAKDKWDFFDEFGYEPSRDSHNIYKACQRAERKVKRVVGDEECVCNILNTLSEREVW